MVLQMECWVEGMLKVLTNRQRFKSQLYVAPHIYEPMNSEKQINNNKTKLIDANETSRVYFTIIIVHVAIKFYFVYSLRILGLM